MKFELCSACMGRGFCLKNKVRLVSDEKLNDIDYLSDLKDFMRSLEISDSLWHEHLANLYRDFPGWIVEADGSETFLDMEEFERPNIREWFRDFLKPLRPGARPRIRAEARSRVRVLATILNAHYPNSALLWGAKIANDNCIPENV